MEKILITGSGGFIGSHLTELCISQGYDVRAFLHYNNNNNGGWLEKSPLKNQMEMIFGDIRDFDSVYNAAKGCDTILHLAALIGIPYSYVSPLAYLKTNIEGTYNILQAGRLLETKNILITSTSETYGTAQYVPINEQHPLVGQSPYSATKISADQLAISYYRSFNTPIKIVRPFNTYGPRQSPRAFIPNCISQMITGKKEINLGNTKPTRDFTYVKDTARGFIAIMKADGLLGEVTNIGMNEEISMGDVVKLVAEIIGVSDYKLNIEEQRIRPSKSEVNQLRCDNSKILKLTDWRPQYNFKKGLNETIEWIKKNIENYENDHYAI